jgi:ElaB/YqjD/DUF883 family membrane-anchored ribosome-binding protein
MTRDVKLDNFFSNIKHLRLVRSPAAPPRQRLADDILEGYTRDRQNGVRNGLGLTAGAASAKPARHLKKDTTMPRKLLAIFFAAFIGGALPAAADDTFFAEQKLTEYLAKDRFIGANVHDNSGKIIGHIEDLIVDNDNRIVGVIIGVGGLLGLGEKKIGVSVSALSIEATDGKMNVVMPAATKEALTATPAYKRVNPPKGWLQRAVEKGEEIRDKSKDALDAAKQQAGPALEKAKSAAKDAYEAAKQQAGPALEKAKQEAREALDKAKQAAQPAEAPKN